MKNNWVALGVLTLGVLMIGIDGTVLSVATPSLSKELGASATDVLWIGDIFSFILAGLLVTMGSLGDRSGHKKLLVGGATAFTLLSVGAAYATTPGMLIDARALLGAAAATLTPATLALIRALFPEKRSRSLAVGIWAATYSAGTALGPVVGGLLLEHFWCGAAFLVNVPVGIAVIVGGVLLLPEMRNPTPGPWDLASAGLSLPAILGLVYAAKESVTQGLQPSVLFAGLLGVSAAVLFVHRQLTLEAPLIDVRLFRNRMFSRRSRWPLSLQ
jgi:DHA2 family multidrug resistance protein-like MFS transporter